MQWNQVLEPTHHNPYSYHWSNESRETYTELFDHIDGTPKQLASVGGGDQILFSLHRFDSLKNIVNVDVSSMSLITTLVKTSVILHGSFGTWKELCHAYRQRRKRQESMRD